MEQFKTYMGEDFEPLSPDIDKLHIEDIAHALSLMCRANGHISRFYSVAQHSLNCAKEAEARGLSERMQLVCLLHDASEAYLSDITRPVKKYLSEYQQIEKRLQEMIYCKFLGSNLTDDETSIVNQIDNDMLACELNALMKMEVYGVLPKMCREPSFEFIGFHKTENEFIQLYSEICRRPFVKTPDVTDIISELENLFQSKSKNEVIDI